MKKYRITIKTLVSKLLIFIPISFLFGASYLSTLYTDDLNNSFELKAYMFLNVWFLVIFFSTLLAMLLLAYVVIRKHQFYDSGDFFVVEKGLFWKREIKLSYKQINTVSIKRSLLDLILKTSKVEVDSGAVLSTLPEIKLHLNKEYALYLKKYLETKKDDLNISLEGPNSFINEDIEDKNIIYKVRNKSLLLMGLIKPGVIATILTITIVVSSILNLGYVNSFNNPNAEFIFTKVETILIVTIIEVILLLLSSLINLVMYYNYKIILNNETLEYEYGLFSKNSFNFNINKINAVYVKRTLLYRLFNKYSLLVSVVGIGDDISNEQKNSKESKYLLPISSKNELEEILTILKYQDILNEDLNKPIKNAKLNLIYIPLILPTILFLLILVLTLKNNSFYYLFTFNIVLVYLIVLGFLLLRYKYHSYKIDDHLLIKSGGFTITKTLVKKESIQIISYNDGPIRRLLGLGTITFKYRSFLKMASIKGLLLEDFNDFNNNIF